MIFRSSLCILLHLYHFQVHPAVHYVLNTALYKICHLLLGSEDTGCTGSLPEPYISGGSIRLAAPRTATNLLVVSYGSGRYG